jgi:translation initiation factor 3 subunit J
LCIFSAEEQLALKKSTEKAPAKKGKKVELQKEEPLDSLAEKHRQQRFYCLHLFCLL